MKWYLLQCKSNQQQRALMHLQNQHFSCFCPTHPVQRKTRRGRLATLRESLFPNYLFIQLDHSCNWRALSATRGVSRVVGFNGSPLPVPDTVVQALQQRCKNTDEPAAPLFRPGERVQITEGAFRDMQAIVAAANGEERVCLLIELMHRQHRVELPVAAVAAS